MAATAAALPNKSPITYYSAFLQLARFDNLSGPPVAIKEIGQYLDIDFKGIFLIPTLNLPGHPGVPPNTPSNMAGFTLVNPVSLLKGPPAMSVNYPDSTVDFFDLESFWYGCVLPTQETVASSPISCDITVTGFSDIAGEQQVCKQTFQFRVDGLVSSLIGGTPVGDQLVTVSKPMLKANLNAGFRGVRKVVFAVADRSLLPSLLTVALLDTVEYTVYSKFSQHQVLYVTGST